MIDIRAHLQSVLDTVLAADGVYSHWQRKTETEDEDSDEYIVYTLDDNANEVYADDAPLITSASFTVRYYYRDSMLSTSAGRTQIKAREDQIVIALIAGGFTLPNGHFDVGDIDDIGFGTTVFPTEFWRVC